MITLTHQQAQEILQAGQEVTEPVRESLAQHLTACADCRAYAVLVDELAQVVPALYPPASLSEQAVRQKAAGKLPLVRRKSMMNRAITSTRAVVWAGIMLALFLLAAILIPKMMVNETGGVVQTVRGTPAPQIEIPAQSELFQSFIWDHQPDLGYVMLRPTNWISQEHGTAARSYIPDAGPGKDNVTLLVTNYQKSAKSLPQGGILVQWELFQANPTLDGWTQALEASWERSNTRYQIEYETDRAKIYFLQIAPGGNGLVAYIMDQGQPFSVALDLRGDIADADQIKEVGIVTDLVTIVDSFNNEIGYSLSRSSTPLPPTSETTPVSQGSVQYTVIEGDTLFGIAEKFNLKPLTILWSNEDQLLDNPNNLQPGITLRIPTVDGLYYRWDTGDTIEAVAARFGADPQAILDWPENTGPFEPPTEIFIPGGEIPLQVAPAVTPQFNPENDLPCTLKEVPLEVLSSSQDSNTGERWYTYTNTVHGFTFRFPAGWTMMQCDSRHPNFLQLRPSGITSEDIIFSIGVRLDSEDVYIMRTGVGSGDIVQQGTVQFLGQEVTRDVLIEEGKTKSVLYDLGKEITRGSLVVTLGLDHFEYRKDANLSPEIQAAADQIVQSFAFAPRANLTNEFDLYFYRPLVVDYDPAVWEDRSEPDNKEMMVNYLQHRELASCTIGARGASGFYPENTQDVTLGDITYQVYVQEIASGAVVQDYFFKSAPTDTFDEVLNTMGIPILEVQYQPSEEQDCLAAAEEVFATLHPSERLINMPYCEKLARDYRTPPNQKTYCDPDYNFAFNYPQDWSIEPLIEVRDTLVLQFVRRMKRFQNPDKSNFIRVDTYRLPATSTLEETFKAHILYPDREYPDHEYEDLRIGGQRAYAFIKRLDQDYSAVYLFFQHGEYYSIMEIKAISSPKLDTNWKIARSIQVPGGTWDDNFFPDQLLIDSYQLVK